MEFLFVSLKILAASFLILILPGLLLISIIGVRVRIANLDTYEITTLSLIAGLAIWIPISLISYSFGVHVNAPIYMLLLVSVAIIFFSQFKKEVKPSGMFGLSLKRNVFDFLNVYLAIILCEAILVGYASQYQAGNSDALTHLASIRNLSSFGTIESCDWILGNGSPIQNTYGCHPWYLTLGMIVNFARVDASLAYTTITATIYIFSVLSIYSLIKAISGDVFIAKIGSIIFSLAALMNWFLIIGDLPIYNLDPINNLIFPGHFASYILFPITLALFIRYLAQGQKYFLVATMGCLFVTTRFHPTWVIWAPIILSGIVIFRNVFSKQFGIGKQTSYKHIFIFFGVSIISGASLLLCRNTFSFDPNIVSPLGLWKGSGGNLLYFSEYLYLYDPMIYFKNRGIFDIATVGLLWYLHKQRSKNQLSENSSFGGVAYNEMTVMYSGALASIALVIFNPMAVYLLIKVTGSSIPLYRTFVMLMPVLSCFTICAVLIYLKVKLEKKSFPLVITALTITFGCLIIGTHFDYLKKLYGNHPNYFSTNASPLQEPFLTLRALGPGKVAVRTPIATATAAFTDLDPLVTEKWRAKSLADFEVNENDNGSILAFDKPVEELRAILKARQIRYIVISHEETDSIKRLNRYPELVQFKSSAGSYEVWEVNASL